MDRPTQKMVPCLLLTLLSSMALVGCSQSPESKISRTYSAPPVTAPQLLGSQTNDARQLEVEAAPLRVYYKQNSLRYVPYGAQSLSAPDSGYASRSTAIMRLPPVEDGSLEYSDPDFGDGPSLIAPQSSDLAQDEEDLQIPLQGRSVPSSEQVQVAPRSEVLQEIVPAEDDRQAENWYRHDITPLPAVEEDAQQPHFQAPLAGEFRRLPPVDNETPQATYPEDLTNNPLPHSLQMEDSPVTPLSKAKQEEADWVHPPTPLPTPTMKPTTPTRRQKVANNLDLGPADRSTAATSPPVATSIEDSTQEVLVEQLPDRLESVLVLPRAVPSEPQQEAQQLSPAESDVRSPEQIAAMHAVTLNAASHVKQGFQLAGRGALYSARNEFIQAMRILSQALDAQLHTNEYSRSLASGLRALQEADDFVPQGTMLEGNLNLEVMISSHRTPVLKDSDFATLSPLQARVAYYTYAQTELAKAVGKNRAGSMACYGLAKLQTTLHAKSPHDHVTAESQAAALHYAALLADNGNYMAANELGVLLARSGENKKARELLVHSVQSGPQVATLRNLAVVCDRLGDRQAAAQATEQATRLAAQLQATGDNSSGVRWESAAAFASQPAVEAPLMKKSAPVAKRPAYDTPQREPAQAASRFWGWRN